MNILSGYDVERPDMTLFSNLYNAAKVLNKEGHTPTWDEILVFLGAVSAMTPIPLNNVIKDVTGIIKTAGGIFTSPDFSPDMLGYAFRDMFIGEQDDSVKLYRAVIAGQTDVIERYCQYDEKDSIGKRYRRQDAIGTPFCITVDHDSLNDHCVTIRHRDSMQQERVKIEDLHAIIAKEVNLSNILKKLK